MHKLMTAREYMRGFHDRGASAFLVLLVLGDLAFILLHFVNELTPTSRNLLSIAKDRSYAELYQYVKFLWIITLLAKIARDRKTVHYVTWVLVFTYFLFDDALKIHELGGDFIAEKLDFTPPLGLRLEDIGELVVSATAGVGLLALVMWTYKSGSVVFRKISQDIALLILLMVIAGVVVDMLHSASKVGGAVGFALGVIEDGGEMLAASLILWRIFLSNVRGDIADSYLSDGVRTALTKRSA